MSEIKKLFDECYPDDGDDSLRLARFFSDFFCWCWTDGIHSEIVLLRAAGEANIELQREQLPIGVRLINHPGIAALTRPEDRVEKDCPGRTVRSLAFSNTVGKFYAGNTQAAVRDALRFVRDENELLRVLVSAERSFDRHIAGGKGAIYPDEFYTFDEIAESVEDEGTWTEQCFEYFGKSRDQILSGAEFNEYIQQMSGDEEE